LGHFRIAGRVLHVEGGDGIALVPHQFDIDVLAHAIHLLIRGPLVVLATIRVDLLNDVQQTRAAENLAA